MKLPEIIITQISQKQLLETGLVAILLCIIIGLVQDQSGWLVAAAVVAGVGLLFPKLLYPVAVFWFSLGNVLSMIVSPILLTTVFLLIITPIGVFRRWLSRDSLQIQPSDRSILKKRDHVFTATDLKNSF
ncbi:MAG: SxtJ family membrane protein [Tunicatimonas sp.]|uniref:SxtJ family membrane protein n=1 Tax=Tunicatimonas sp. TaxID=1940096 RepID=UPI003C784847